MATRFPAALDVFANPTGVTDLDTSAFWTHGQQHSDLNDAVEAIQNRIGIDGVVGSVQRARHTDEHAAMGSVFGISARAGQKSPFPVFGGSAMDISEVTIVSGSPTLSVETDYAGRKRLKVVTGSGTAAQISFAGMANCYFGGDAYVQLQGSYEDGLSAMSMYFAPGATIATNYILTGAINFAAAVVDPYLQPGAGAEPFVWRTGKKNNAITGSITYPFTVGSHKLVITPRAATVATVYIYGIGIGVKNKKGRCFIIADDGNASWLTVGAPLFNDAGIPTTGSIIASVVGTTATDGNLRQWQTYVDAGNSVVAYGPNGADANTDLISAFTSTAERVADMEISRDYIFANNLQRAFCDLCYVWPQGQYQESVGDVTLLDAALTAGFKLARCSAVINPLVQYNADAVTKYQRLALPYSTHGWAGTTAGQVALITALTDAITAAATYGTDIFVTFHQVVPDSTADGAMDSTKCRVSDLLTIRTAIANAVTAGTLECFTLPEIAYKPAIGVWTL